MNNKLIIYAPNIHQGGGKTLLLALKEVFNIEVHVFVDQRISGCDHQNSVAQIRFIRPTMWHRFLAELELKKLVKSGDVVLCMGNLPPLFQLRGKTNLFVQNRLLIEEVSLRGLKLKTRTRIFVERLWLKTWSFHVDRFIVQTPSMKHLLQKKLENACEISIKPFLIHAQSLKRHHHELNAVVAKDYDFVYIASGEPHKNHRNLIEAWVLLAKDGIFPSLCITVDHSHFSTLHNWINKKAGEFLLNISNLGSIPHTDVLKLYKKCSAAIYPSTLESFGIPLVEARQAGLPILASELDYVRDLLDPEEVFDPSSAISIARSVKRHLGIFEPHLEVADANEFINFLIGDGS